MTKGSRVTKAKLKQIDRVIDSYREQKWALIPLLHKIQEVQGYIPTEVIPRIARKAECNPPKQVFGYAKPFQCERSPVRVTLSALNAVPAMAIAFVVLAGSSPSAFEAPAATAYEP